MCGSTAQDVDFTKLASQPRRGRRATLEGRGAPGVYIQTAPRAKASAWRVGFGGHEGGWLVWSGGGGRSLRGGGGGVRPELEQA